VPELGAERVPRVRGDLGQTLLACLVPGVDQAAPCPLRLAPPDGGIPGPAGNSDWIVTDLAGRLLLQSSLGVSGPSSLFWFDPTNRFVRFVFRAPADTYGIYGVIPYGNQSK